MRYRDEWRLQTLEIDFDYLTHMIYSTCEQRGLGIREAAREMKVSQSTISNMKAGRYHDLYTRVFMSMVHWLDMDAEDFVKQKGQSL